MPTSDITELLRVAIEKSNDVMQASRDKCVLEKWIRLETFDSIDEQIAKNNEVLARLSAAQSRRPKP